MPVIYDIPFLRNLNPDGLASVKGECSMIGIRSL